MQTAGNTIFTLCIHFMQFMQRTCIVIAS